MPFDMEIISNTSMIPGKKYHIIRKPLGGVFESYFHSGQICMTVNRIIVDESIIDNFRNQLVDAVKQVKVGDPNKEDTIVGPLITSEESLEKAKEEGAEVLLEGKREGNVISPIVIKGTNETYTSRQEMFGPVVTVIPPKDEEEAIRLANDVEEGLTSSVYSTDLKRAHEAADQIQAGMTHINDQCVNDEPYIAFGGEKGSGIGRCGREHSLDFLLLGNEYLSKKNQENTQQTAKK